MEKLRALVQRLFQWPPPPHELDKTDPHELEAIRAQIEDSRARVAVLEAVVAVIVPPPSEGKSAPPKDVAGQPPTP